MANDLIDILRNNPALVNSQIDDDTRAVAGGGGTQSKRISIEGGVFRKVVGGKEVAKIEDRHMDVIFVKMAHTPSRQCYAEAYTKGQKVSPICWSSDAKKPDPEVKSPVASDCESCPYSVKGSGQGGKGSKCRISWRTAVVLPGDPTGDVMQLIIPGQSCWGETKDKKWPFKPYVQMVANHGISVGRVITKMQFDTDSSSPKLLFSVAGAVPDTDLTSVAAQAKSPGAERAVKLTVFQNESADDTSAQEGEVAVQEPKVRETVKKAEASGNDMADVVKKWSKK